MRDAGTSALRRKIHNSQIKVLFCWQQMNGECIKLSNMQAQVLFFFKFSVTVYFRISCFSLKVSSALVFPAFALRFCFPAFFVASWFSPVCCCQCCPWLISPVFRCPLLKRTSPFLLLFSCFLPGLLRCFFAQIFSFNTETFKVELIVDN